MTNIVETPTTVDYPIKRLARHARVPDATARLLADLAFAERIATLANRGTTLLQQSREVAL